jgi:hypothetical protein
VRLAEHKARQVLTYVHSRSRRPSGAAMRMVRLSRDASKQDEARELLAPVYRSVEPRPSSSLIHRQCLDRSFLFAKPTTSFARSTDGDRLLTAIIDQQICLMLHDGERVSWTWLWGFPNREVPMCVTSAFTMSDRGRRRSATSSPPATLARTRGGFAASEQANQAVYVLPGTELSLHSFAQ